MNKEQFNIDELFREKLENHSVNPSSHVLDGVQRQMKAQRRKKIIAFYSRVAAAAIIILAFLAGWYFNEQSGKVEPEMVQNEPLPQQQNQNFSAGKETAADSLKQMNDRTAQEVESLLAANNENETNTPFAAEQSSANPAKSAEVHARTENIRMPLLEKMKAEVVGTEHASLAQNHEPAVKETTLTEAEKRLIAANSLAVTNREQETGGWKMGLNISPGYSSNESSHSGAYSRNMTYQSTEGTANIGGGISVQYKTSKRWSIESGVYYAQNGQKSGNSRDAFAFASSPQMDYALRPAVENASFNTAVQVVDNQIAMNSTAGVIAFDKLPEGTVLAANPEEDAAFSNTLMANGEFSQVFDFVEIPLYLRYLVFDSKVDVEILGGINAGLVVGNNAYMENDNGTRNIGKTKDISPVNMSGTIGFGMNYALGKKFSLAVEPRFNYFLNSINSNPAVNYRPYRIGVYTGLYYDF